MGTPCLVKEMFYRARIVDDGLREAYNAPNADQSMHTTITLVQEVVRCIVIIIN